MTPGHHSPASVSSSGASDSGSTSADDVDRELERDPFYFMIDGAMVLHNGQQMVLRNVDRSRSICSVAYVHDPQRIAANHVPLHQIQHLVPESDGVEADQRVKVVAGKLNGEFGTLIGIDNDEAVVQLQATTEVNIIHKKFIVLYVDT